MYQIKIVVLLEMLIGVLLKICFADLKPKYLISGLKWNDFRNHLGLNTRSDLSIGVGFDLNVEKTSRVELLKTNFQGRLSGNKIHKVTMNDLNYVSVHKGIDFDVFSTVGISNLKLETGQKDLFNFGVGVSRRLTDKLKWRAQIKKIFPSDNLDSFSRLQVGLSMAYQLNNLDGKKGAPRYAANAGAAIRGNPLSTNGKLPLGSRCSNLQMESRYSRDECTELTLNLEQSDLVFYFDFDQVKINGKDSVKIKRIVSMLDQHPDLNIVLQGHTDSIGTKDYNQRLSEKRAIQVRNAMISQFGAPSDRILTAGFGEGLPVEDNTSGHGRAKNRRVVTVGFEAMRTAGF